MQHGSSDLVTFNEVPRTFEEQVSLSRTFRTDWIRSKTAARDIKRQAELCPKAFAEAAFVDANFQRNYWHDEHWNATGVAPLDPFTRELTVTEYGIAVTAKWNFFFWSWVADNLFAAYRDAEVCEDPSRAMATAALRACEIQAPLLDGGLIVLGTQLNRAGRCQLNLAVPAANLAGWCAANLSTSRGMRMGRALEQVAEGGNMTDALLTELQSVVFAVAPDDLKALLEDPLVFRSRAAREVERVAGQPEREVGLVGELPVDQESSAFKELAAEDELARLVEAAGLTPRQRRVLEDELAGFSLAETAKRLEVADGTVKAMRNHVKNKLRAASRARMAG